MKLITFTVAILILLCTALCCCKCTPPRMPGIHVNVPSLQAGEMQEKEESIPLGNEESAQVEIRFGTGELWLAAGEPEELFSGKFRYNVEEWEPEISYRNGRLRIEQGGLDRDLGFPSGNAHNKWELEYSPDIPLDIEIKAGAGEGELDFTGLRVAELEMDVGAGDFVVRFDEPNPTAMRDLTVNAGASELEISGIGNAGPQRMTVQGGVGNVTLDFTGAWPRSANVYVTAGVGALTLRLPDNVGVRVRVAGALSSVDAPDFHRSGNDYVNDAFGEAETELDIRVTTGVGSVRLIEVSNE